MTADAVRSLLREKDYAGLERELAQAVLPALARLWPSLEPMEKLVAFKLLDAARAMELFGALPFADKYLLLGAFPLQAIAPVLEGLAPARRRPFVQLPREDCELMFRRLLSDGPAPAK